MKGDKVWVELVHDPVSKNPLHPPTWECPRCKKHTQSGFSPGVDLTCPGCKFTFQSLGIDFYRHPYTYLCKVVVESGQGVNRIELLLEIAPEPVDEGISQEDLDALVESMMPMPDPVPLEEFDLGDVVNSDRAKALEAQRPQEGIGIPRAERDIYRWRDQQRRMRHQHAEDADEEA